MLRNWTDYVLFENFFKKTRNQEELGPLEAQEVTCILRYSCRMHVIKKNCKLRNWTDYMLF